MNYLCVSFSLWSHIGEAMKKLLTADRELPAANAEIQLAEDICKQSTNKHFSVQPKVTGL